jgi:hypothetical protein
MSKIGLLRASLLELLEEHRTDDTIPTSSRFLFYELVQRQIISKERKPGGSRRPDQDMNDALTDLRESGQIPWDWIVDETRSLEDYTGHNSIKEGLAGLLPGIRIDPWNGDIPLILTESRSLAGGCCVISVANTVFRSLRPTANVARFCTRRYYRYSQRVRLANVPHPDLDSHFDFLSRKST